MSEALDHPDIEKLPLEIDGIAVREVVRGVFRDSVNGTPDDISKEGCLALAGRGYLVWNAWREVFPVDGATNRADFSGVNFHCRCISFAEMHFGEKATFEGALFGYRQSFQNAEFGDRANFVGAQFANDASFNNARFEGDVDFYGLHWESLTDIYSDGLDAAKAWAIKLGTSPRSFMRIDFANCYFGGEVFFLNREFKSQAVFDGCKFEKVPKFHGCELHQDTSFERADFPTATGNHAAARAYRTLKLAFSNQQSVREEQEFFALEMKEETVGYGLKAGQALHRQIALFDFVKNGTAWLLHKIYKWTSNYGISFWKPVFWLIGSVCLFACIYAFLKGQTSLSLSFDAVQAKKWVQLSLLQTFPFPGFDELAKKSLDHLLAEEASLVMTIFIVIQKITSLLLLFLSGLALRNLFKLK